MGVMQLKNELLQKVEEGIQSVIDRAEKLKASNT
jgi:hypothetical protein